MKPLFLFYFFSLFLRAGLVDFEKTSGAVTSSVLKDGFDLRAFTGSKQAENSLLMMSRD